MSISNQIFKEALNDALVDFGLDPEMSKQKEGKFWRKLKALLFHFLNKNDFMGVLPTNFSKSIIYQLALNVARTINTVLISVTIIVVSPINDLISDQIKSCKNVGLGAMKH